MTSKIHEIPTIWSITQSAILHPLRIVQIVEKRKNTSDAITTLYRFVRFEYYFVFQVRGCHLCFAELHLPLRPLRITILMGEAAST